MFLFVCVFVLFFIHGIPGLLEWHSRVIFIYLFFCRKGGRPPDPSEVLGQLLGRLHLLLGHLLLRHDGHPRRNRPSDRLLGHVVVVDEGEEAPAAPGALRGVVPVEHGRHAVALLLQEEVTRHVELR